MLSKYHKQKQPKERIQSLKKIKEVYRLKYDLNQDSDILKLSVFKQSLEQKAFFESTYEKLRNELFDMWDHLSFYEKNDLLLKELDQSISNLKSFNYEGFTIYMPFFDTLLNSLYATETAILEKPQFFKLYHEFKDHLIPVETYGNLPLSHGFTHCETIIETTDALVLYDDLIKVFYLITKSSFTRFPIYKESQPNAQAIQKIAQGIIMGDIDALHHSLVALECVSKPFLKRYQRQQKRLQKKEKKRNAIK